MAFAPDGKWIVSGSADGTARLWDSTTGKPVRTLKGHGTGIRSVAFSPDQKRVFAAGVDGTVMILNTATGEELYALAGHEAGLWSVAVSPDGKTVAAAGTAPQVLVWETGPPPAGAYAARRTTETAEAVVDARFEQLVFADEVIRSLRDDDALDETVRQAALQTAAARGDNPYVLNQQSWAVVRSPGQDDAAYRLAVRKAEAACRVASDSATYRSTLGVAQYRVADYENALATLRRADETYTAVEERSHPRDVAFNAMTLHRLGHKEDARKELERLRGLMQDEEWANVAELKAFLAEAKALILEP